MLMLVGYDLEKDPDNPLNYAETLGAALQECGGHPGDAINVAYGPRFVKTDKEPQEVVNAILQRLGAQRNDKLLVLEISPEGNWATRAVEPTTVAWLANEDRLRAPCTGPLLALAYTLHHAPREEYEVLLKKLAALPILHGEGHLHPLHALSFLETDRAPWAIRDEVAKLLKDHAGVSHQDELLVVPVTDNGAQHGLGTEEIQWFRQRGIHLTEVAKAA